MQTLIGLKRLSDAKTRLHPDVPAGERRQLMLAMLTSVVGAARESAIGPVALASSESTAPGLARTLHVALVSDGGLPWNEGLVHALAAIVPQPAAVLYLAGDLPLLTAAELIELVARAPRPGVSVARARDGGTNALLVAPSAAMPPSFGVPRSADAHRRAADALGLPCELVDLPGLALDVDTVRDAWDAGVLARPLSERGHGPARG